MAMIVRRSRNSVCLLHEVLSSSHLLPCSYIQRQTYVDVYMKWKKDSFFDSIDTIHRSVQLKPLIALKNCIVSSSPDDYCVPISAISKKGLELGIPIKVAMFLRLYPSVFEEFTGPKYNLPWFRLTQRAVELDREEREVYVKFKDDIILRLKKLILMSGREKMLPLKVIQGLQWYLGLPDEFLRNPEDNLDKCFRLVEMEDGLKGLAVNVDGSERFLSMMQRNAMRRGVYSGVEGEVLEFQLFPSKGLRLKRKIADWFDEFQRLPYVSPYEDYSGLDPNSDTAEKRVVGVLHELLSLFVEHAAERKKLLCLRKHFGLPQKVHKAFERHPYIFYLSLNNKTCTAILKEAYCDRGAIEQHPLAKVRKKYISLMKESADILKRKRLNNRPHDQGNMNIKDLDYTDDEEVKLQQSSSAL
ncbi:PREDICTED: protein ROOT PRIMORDIUM DEFECTIVE 1 [Nicotiana attenuata]|uniref:Protein root primordium defective 1 n=1 Tax=Nicotiana attenuata TaxID=49451 RepID=A0A314L275_NICAT|nr:PREDICTED: protein ROOT PRIMORDIUM DEFECTIVE 1 [Nicotiana attenuata]OIT35738.1 protein root primordium defective 1 [Nicotiana attenuata]